MKCIGSGLQYNVYDIGRNRVRKIPTTYWQKLRKIHSWRSEQYNPWRHPLHVLRFAYQSYRTLEHSFSGFYAGRSIDPALIGNPHFYDNYVYEQDKVTPLGERLQSVDAATQQNLIDQYIANVRSCWACGFSDTVYNFTINNGVTADGTVILIDIGEITWDKTKAQEVLKAGKLFSDYSFNSLEDTALQAYIETRFNTDSNPTELERLWGSSLHI